MTDSMDISQETQAPSTERSHQPPPIPNSPFASPTPLLNLEPPTKTSGGRLILKPVAPSKRPITERPTPSCSNKISSGNAFLPKELAEIVAIRQLRERAWHARLMICSNAISSIESTLANFKEAIEKEKVAAFKAYLQLTIANIAAVDSSPSPPQIPIHTRPTKGDRIGKDRSNTKKVTIVIPPKPIGVAIKKKVAKETPSLPNTPQISENTWATVARAGQKKARVILNNSTQVNLTGIQSRRPANKEKSKHEWRKLSPAGIRGAIVKKLHISPSLIGRVKPVHSGFALSPCSPEASEEIIKAGNGLFLSGAKLEIATNWASVLVPTVPASIKMEQGL
ncbi:hypothetical protein EPUL_004491, partial [Erysiphe pulchra]